METRVCALRSGSSGNAIFVESGHTAILVDAGVNGKTIERALADLDVCPRRIQAMLITHEHRDHIAGAGVLARRYGIPIHVNLETYQAMQGLIGKVDPSLIHIIEPDRSYSIGDICFSGFDTSHDSGHPLGYRIQTSCGDVTVCTDTGVATPEMIQAAAGSKLVFIEANYDDDMLDTGPYPYFLKKRIKGSRGHLSNADCACVVASLLNHGTRHFVLSHLSRDNNLPELALQTIRQSLSMLGADAVTDTWLTVAKRYATSEPISLSQDI